MRTLDRWLAQTGANGSSIGDAVLWILILIGAVIVLGVVLMHLRKALLGHEEDENTIGLPVAELRRLRDAGELSEEQFQRAVSAMASRAKAARKRDETDNGS
ncbi:MAG: hypothetical protein AAGB48_11035 [Planctomycetota bacterium]